MILHVTTCHSFQAQTKSVERLTSAPFELLSKNSNHSRFLVHIQVKHLIETYHVL